MPTLSQDDHAVHQFRGHRKSLSESSLWLAVCDFQESALIEWNERHKVLSVDKNIPWMIQLRPAREVDPVHEELAYHIEKWKKDTAHLSSVARTLSHPSYLRIIALGGRSKDVVRYLLVELETEPTFWFAALRAITGCDPVKAEHDFDQAVAAWLQWGRTNGYWTEQ